MSGPLQASQVPVFRFLLWHRESIRSRCNAGVRRCVRALSLMVEDGTVLEERKEADSVPQVLKALDMSYPTYVVWGANTGVGKTLVSAGLAMSILSSSASAEKWSLGGGKEEREERKHDEVRNVLYLKPVQTGFPRDSDARFVLNQVYRTLKNQGGAVSEGSILTNHTLQASPAVHAAFKHVSKSSQGLEEPLLVQSQNQGMKDLCRYEGYAVGFDRDMVNPRGKARLVGNGSHLSCKTLWAWYDPVSPHLAAAKENSMVTDYSVLQSLKNFLWNLGSSHSPNETTIDARGTKKWAIIETAGGVASPAPSGALQCDLYRPLRLPGLLVGDGKLGGISSTIAAYESLHLRGYDTDAIVLVDAGMGNVEALRKHLGNKVPVLGLSPLPEDPADDLAAWYLESASVFTHLQSILEEAHVQRLDRLQRMPAKALRCLWWPFTQHSLVRQENVTLIDSRCGEFFSVFEVDSESRRGVMNYQFDGCGSWWTQGPDAQLQIEFAKELAYAAGRYGHVLFPENVHEPSLRCTEILLQSVGKGWADRVFFSDNGSTGVEIAIKMAFRKFAFDHGYAASINDPNIPSSSEQGLQFKVLALRGSYHGDTLGAMEAQAPSSYTGFRQQPWYSGRGLFLDPPTVSLQARQWHLHLPLAYSPWTKEPASFAWHSREEIFCDSRDATELAEVYRTRIEEILSLSAAQDSANIAGLIMEPVVHGAGGMHMLDPLFQRILVQQCKQRRIPVIFDEVFAGCWRLGAQSAAELLRVTPDIACYSKLLTGGMVPMAVTLASEDVYAVFTGESKLDALLHGHSYTAHPLGCVSAITALQSFADPSKNLNLLPELGRLKELWDLEIVNLISEHPAVSRVICLGTLFALELRASPSESGYGSMLSKWLLRGLRQDGIYARPLGNVVYLICGPTTSPATCSQLLSALLCQLDGRQNGSTA